MTTKLGGLVRLFGCVLALLLIAPSRAVWPDESGEDGPRVEFFLPILEAERGETLDVPFQLRSDIPLSMITWSVEYDTTVFEFLEPALTPSVQALMDGHPPDESLFLWFVESEAEAEPRFEASPELSGDQLAPPVDTPAWGQVRFDLTAEKLDFRLEVGNIEGVTEAWLHLGSPGEEGPEVALLASFPGAGLSVEGDERIAEGVLDDADLLPAPGHAFDGTVASLIEALRSGSTYVVVRTLSHPTGELRGQLVEKEDDGESWLQVAVVTDFLGRTEFSIPADELVSFAQLSFRILDDAPEGNHELKFSLEQEATFEGNFYDGEKVVFNVVGASGRERDEIDFTLGSVPATVNDGGVLLSIIGDVQILRVGDANHDGAVDISDPVRILQYLFSSSVWVTCLATIDTNDDGSINIADATNLLRSMFFVSSSVWVLEPISTTRAIKPSPECF